MWSVFVVACCVVRVSSGDVEADVDRPSRELNVTELNYYVNTEDGKAILEKEFQGIEGGKRRPWTVAEREENLWKNRYLDLLAFDDTRVRLPYDEGSDYINANYVDGYHYDKEYVATQGPLLNTTKDFWAMIWHLKATKIVMLANLIEHGESKVAKYWPDVMGVYGRVIVTKVAEFQFSKFQHILRLFHLTKPGVSSPRLVRQFHYTGWPDLGVPSDRKSVLALMHQVRRYPNRQRAPIVVHCSAGVGRTGTVLLLDSMLERARSEGVVDFPLRLDHMRLQRVDAVEKKEQYIFAHAAVDDALNDNDTASFIETVEEEYMKRDFMDLYESDKTTDELEEKWVEWSDEESSTFMAPEIGFWG